MRGHSVGAFVAGLVVCCVMATRAPAGPIAETVGKGWDKVAAGIVKVNEKAKAAMPKGKLIKGAKASVAAKAKGLGGGKCCK